MTEDTTMRILLRGDAARYAALTDEILESVLEAAEADEFILKSRTARFEAALCAELGAAHAVGCASTAGGLLLALGALGCGPGDEVIVPAWGPEALSGIVQRLGSRPVLVDVSPEDGAPDVAAVTAAVGPATRAVLLGPAGSDEARARLHEAALRLGVPIVEVGTPEPHRPRPRGVTTVVPLGPDDLLGGIGDAAAVVTDDETLAQSSRMLRNHGQALNERFLHIRVGYNCRMDESVAAFLLRRLPSYGARRTAMRELADRYARGLSSAGTGALVLRPETCSTPSGGLTLRTALRELVHARLAAQGVETAMPSSCPDGSAVSSPPESVPFPGARLLAEQSLSLPLYPGLAPADVDLVVGAVAECLAGHQDVTR
ncbi:DegT/DnrJ/EryC1/StrS family aminotransferase [Streptomyces sp. NPDC097595]|uniref:DegT/DnrJ/EryC1/StrS family aminotransferase n=1 Tax=Streptomyces sp. NPDC097595 TaxID=3366090 RepID=UPI0038249933